MDFAMPPSIELMLLLRDDIDCIIDANAAFRLLCCSAESDAEEELIAEDDDEELTLEEDATDDLDDDEEDFFTTGFAIGFTTGFTGFFWMIRASVVHRPGTIPSSSDVQCSIPTQSLGE